MSKKDLYVLNGGIGKQICFTSCLNKLDKVNVMSSWHKLFYNHPNVNFSYDYTLSPITDDTEFLSKFKNVYMVECYDSFFHCNKIHLVQNYRRILNQDLNENIYSEIYFDTNEEENIKPLLEQLKDFVLVQFVGSDESSLNTDFIGSRALIKDQSQKIIDILNFDLKLNVLNVFSIKDLFNNTCKIETKLGYMDYALLLKHAKGFIGIDSSVNHMSSNRFCNTKGVVIWNDNNVKERYSYDKNINLISNTPKVMRIEPNEVIDNFMQIKK